MLELVDADHDTDDARFPVERVAAGYRLWLQLAVYGAIGALEEQEAILVYLADWGESESPQSVQALFAFSDALPRDLPSLGPTRHPALEVLGAWIRTRLPALEPTDLAPAPAMSRSRLFLIDEPEQHLHPRLVSAAARWLEKAMGTSREVAVVTTHHPAFLNLSQACRYVYVVRGRRETVYRPFAPDAITAVDQIATEMGFDRGQLLLQLGAVLFVEGRMDHVVLETLVGDQLRRAGIALAIFGGVGNIEDLLRNPLLRYHSAPVAVLVDSVSLAEARRIRDDPEHRAHVLSTGRAEERAVAQILNAAAQMEHHVEPYGLAGDDIIDVLDDEALRAISPRWPGHRDARSEYDKDCESRRSAGRKRLKRKDFYERRFDLPVTLDTCRRAAQTMAAAGRCPEPIRELVTNLERLALR